MSDDVKEKNPLWMPKGSVRALIAVSIVGASIYALLSGRVTIDEFLMVTAVITGFYFTTRNGN